MIPARTSFRYGGETWRVVAPVTFLHGKATEHYYIVANRRATAILPVGLVESHVGKGRA